jgi:hypothetical protein
MTLDEYGRGGWGWLVAAYLAAPLGRSFLVLEDGVIVARCGYQRLPQPSEPCPGARLASLAAASASIAGEFLSACLAGRRSKGLLPCRGKPGRWIRYLTGIRPPEPSDAETAAIRLAILQPVFEGSASQKGRHPGHADCRGSVRLTAAQNAHPPGTSVLRSWGYVARVGRSPPYKLRRRAQVLRHRTYPAPLR